MWWSASVSERPPRLGRPADGSAVLLRELGLEPTGGLWSDAAHTIGVARSDAGLFVGWLDVGWLSCDDPFSELRDVSHLVERVTPDQLRRDLAFAIAESTDRRAEHLRDCGRCGERFVPGQMYGASCCHSCAVRDGDVSG